MKKIFIVICLFYFTDSFSQERVKYQKETFIVSGNCEMCKKKIEKTAKLVEGVKRAKWNVINGEMKIRFNTKKTNLDIIQKSIANIGYDTELYKATDESYNNLHFCCKYREPLKD